MTKSVWSIGIVASTVFLCSCGAAPPPPPETPLYVPGYSFPVTGTGEKIDVTVGLVAPQYGEKSKPAAVSAFPGMPVPTSPWEDDLGRNFVSGLRSSFNELLSAKGFNVTGPFDSLENMTFPEKKGADFVLYPEIDVALGQTIANKGVFQKEAGWSTPGVVGNDCEVTLSIGGNVLIVAKEPLSGEKMWMKRVEIVGNPAQAFSYNTTDMSQACEAVPLSREAANAKAKLLEDAYKAVMTALDKYVTGEEFQMLKKQAAELREKKAY